MRRRFFILTILLALMVQMTMLVVYANEGNGTYVETWETEDCVIWDEQNDEEYYDYDPYDPENWEQQDNIQLHEEEKITFDSFTTRELQDVEILRKGIDVSDHQGDIDWAKVKADGVEFAFVRVGYHGLIVNSLNEDSCYQKNIEGALAQGIQVGVYFYSQAITVEEAIAEADYVLERIAGYGLSLPVVFDYEYGSYNGTPGRLLAANLTKEEATAICKAFMNRVESKGYNALVYANRNFLYNQLNREELGETWMAHYALETDYQGDYAFWQCTSSGRVDGISGYVDLNFWFDDGTYQTVLPFRDVSVKFWGYKGIRYAYEKGLVKGVSDNAFAPEENATRGDVVTMLYRLMGSPEVKQKSPFTDLTHKYHEDPVAWGYEKDIIKGRTATAFDPAASVTRQELVTMLYRLAGEPKSNGDLSGYTDAASVGSFSRAAMTWAVEKGLIQGSKENGEILLDPKGTATRAQIATILMRYQKYIAITNAASAKAGAAALFVSG